MLFSLRRYVYYTIFFVPIIWLVIVTAFLLSSSVLDSARDVQPSSTLISSEDIELNLDAHRDSNLPNKSNQLKSKDEEIHPVRDQVIAPNIDEKEANSNDLGAMGKAVHIDKNKLSPGEQKKYEEGLKNNAFNAYVSDLISIHRTLPDVRDPECRKIQYRVTSTTASIVMCFHNEAWSTLLRSIHSIIDRSPSHLLKQIILVDDFSDMDHLKKPLDDYLANLSKVSVVRLTKREGLIRARLAGAATVHGDVIVFLDSHIEVAEGWLEPLLDPISQNRSIVITPVIDVINDMTFQYSYGIGGEMSVGGFNWDMQFTWQKLSERERKRRTHHLEPVRSPTMAGGLFAISKRYFDEIGQYDEGMDIWGAENLEISFRIWMCGGTLLTAPCSHVGHIFRARSPYKSLPGVFVFKKNSIRVAEVWLDDYKKYYYERFSYNLGDYGDVNSRKLLRKRLRCKSFQWYLNEIYPELTIPEDGLAVGEIRNLAVNFCVDGNAEARNFHKPVIGYTCHRQGGNQYFQLTAKGEIRRDNGCLDYTSVPANVNKDDQVLISKCDGKKESQYWVYNEQNQLYHTASNLCMVLLNDNQYIQMQKCDQKDLRQSWVWKRQTVDIVDIG